MGSLGRAAKGFTLIELMIVVAIIGVLASVSIGAFQGYILRSKEAEALENLRTLYQGLAAYYQRDHVVSNGTDSQLRTRCLPAGHATFTPRSGAPVPSPVVAGEKQVADFGSDPTFSAIDFMPVGAVWHSYAVLNPPVSVCELVNYASPGAEGGVGAFHDHDDDGDIDLMGFSWRIIDRELRRNGGILTMRDAANW